MELVVAILCFVVAYLFLRVNKLYGLVQRIRQGKGAQPEDDGILRTETGSHGETVEQEESDAE